MKQAPQNRPKSVEKVPKVAEKVAVVTVKVAVLEHNCHSAIAHKMGSSGMSVAEVAVF
ncbi:MAG: hypothetical protein II875_12625 [Clostridia bacterium]|nr:hypothetical protein [Clostridia bacterium]